MSDKFKGALVTFEGEVGEERADYIINALKMVKGVKEVKLYVKGMEDYMSEEKGRLDYRDEVLQFIRHTK